MSVLPANALAVICADSVASTILLVGTTKLVFVPPGEMTSVSITLIKPVVSVEL
ncbi:hypothetical protein [Streptococcus suis]|uniref:hypothetical protein n=1 Tax=Streptococcus suis TaxID=1307 RepID=UPI0020046988|nr:hypothetical protein [Streptococcus suis]HEM6095027.1 hypothetical protein [Streptococcus suis]